jgi:hypothetical protein
MTVAALALIAGLVAADAPEVPLQTLGRLDHPAIREASGIVASRKYPGIFWVHNDSGNPPALFAVKRDGSLVREFAVSVPNIDWEDIATDDHGHLYLGEIGNNDGRLPVRAVYQFDEPDPYRPDGPEPRRPLRATTGTYYRFPKDGSFDAEGLVIDGDKALVVAKTFEGQDAEVYAVPLKPPAPLFRPALPEKVGTLPGFTDPVTGADLSKTGRLAVCSTRSVGVFERDGSRRWVPVARRRFRAADQIEAIAWDGDDLILAGELRGVYRIAADDWRGPEPKTKGRQGRDHGR